MREIKVSFYTKAKYIQTITVSEKEYKELMKYDGVDIPARVKREDGKEEFVEAFLILDNRVDFRDMLDTGDIEYFNIIEFQDDNFKKCSCGSNTFSLSKDHNLLLKMECACGQYCMAHNYKELEIFWNNKINVRAKQ